MATSKQLTTVQQQRFDKCWGVWRKKKSKGQAMTTWAKHEFSESETLMIFAAITEQNRAGERYCEKRYLPHFSTWLNNMGWEDEIPSASTIEHSESSFECVFCPTQVPVRSTLCYPCETKYQAIGADERVEWFKSLGLYSDGMPQQEFIANCRKYVTNNVSGIGK